MNITSMEKEKRGRGHVLLVLLSLSTPPRGKTINSTLIQSFYFFFIFSHHCRAFFLWLSLSHSRSVSFPICLFHCHSDSLWLPLPHSLALKGNNRHRLSFCPIQFVFTTSVFFYGWGIFLLLFCLSSLILELILLSMEVVVSKTIFAPNKWHIYQKMVHFKLFILFKKWQMNRMTNELWIGPFYSMIVYERHQRTSHISAPW